MAVRKSIATGNFTTAATWGVVDATSYVNSETTTTALTTSYQANTGVTTGVITVDGVCLKLSVRTGTTGTMSVHLAIAGVEVAGTLVTINTADLPVAATADLNGGWHFFKFASPVVLLGATSYTVEAKTSSGSMVSLFSVSGSNWSVAYVTTTTGAPAAGDDLIVAGEYTGAGTSNSFTVTMDNTASVDFGAASTSLVTPALAICNKGTLTWGVAASTAYQLKVSGNIIVYSGGIHNKGTVVTPTPGTSSTELILDSGANVDFGIVVRNLGTWVEQGAVKTIVWTYLNTDEAAASTVIGLVSTAGWAANDVLAFAATRQTPSHAERKTISTVDSATQVTLTAGLTNLHDGTSPTQAGVGNLTRNSKTHGASTSLQGYFVADATSTVDIDYAEYYNMGSATANKRGMDIKTTTGSFNMRYSSIYDFTVASSIAFNITSASGSNITISNNVMFSNIGLHITNAATTGTQTFDSNFIVYNSTSNTDLVNIADLGTVFTNNYVANASSGSGGDAVTITESGGATWTGTFSGNTMHTCAGVGLTFGAVKIEDFTLSSCSIWRNVSSGMTMTASGQSLRNPTFTDLTMFGNGTNNILITAPISDCKFINLISNGDSTFATTSGVNINFGGVNLGNIYFYGANFSTAAGIKTAHTNDINISLAGAWVQIYMNNCIMAATTEVATQSNLRGSSFIGSQKHDQMTNTHKQWKQYGTITIETTAGLFDVTPGIRGTPNSATGKLEIPIGRINLNSGQTATPSIKVRESVVGDGTDYNGNFIRLIVKRNDAAGITADTVLATATGASAGAFETISGTTASTTDICQLEFVIDCDGTTGWINADTFTTTIT